MRSCCTILLLLCTGLPPAWGGDPESAAFDLLERRCGDCHSSDEPERGLDLSSPKAVLTGSTRRSVVVPGRGAASLLVQVLGRGAKPHMPPDEQLTEDEIALVGRWIDGLPADTPVGRSRVAEGRSHWSFRPVARPTVPTVTRDSWSRTSVDRFVLARLRQAELQPSEEAPRATLLRRLSFDLIGLPPTPEEVVAFDVDDRPDAYERVVDRLLASPHYGERWGRHWLDLARYADSSGFHEDHDRPAAWRYRDYVVASFNADKPYGRFALEQLAGDELPDATVETWTATGFGTNGPANETNVGKSQRAKEQYRLDQLDDVIATTSSVFLGLTLACARCHDHEYDPLPQRDYYRFLAFFDGTDTRRLELGSLDAAEPKSVPFKERGKHAYLRVRSDVRSVAPTTNVLWRGDPANKGPVVEPGVPSVLDSVAPFSPGESTDRRASLARWLVGDDNPLFWRVMANRVWQHHFGRGLVATPSNLGLRGAEPTHPDLLDWLADELRRSGGSLKSLHRTIVTSSAYRQSSASSGAGPSVDPQNLLLWRANRRRLEAEPLRDAILAVSGRLNRTMGGPGIHPRVRPELLVASQRNKWPVVEREGPEHWRRGVYVYVKRQLQLPMLELFDGPSTNHSCARRAESLVPTQALLLMNDEFVRDQSAALASRVARQAGSDDQDRVAWLLRTALGRPAEAHRIDEGIAFLAAQEERLRAEGVADARHEALTDLCQVVFNLSEFLYLE